MKEKTESVEKIFKGISIKFPSFVNKKYTININTTTVSNVGILVTCVLLSIASGFIDLTFFSGLSKSLFHISTFSIPAAALYTIISLGMISGKFWCAMRLGAIVELQTRLRNDNYTWYRNIDKVKFKWNLAHKFLIGISIITALSFSIGSIGVGIRTIEQNINNMSYDATQLIKLQESLRSGNTDIKDAKKNNITGALAAQQSVINTFDEKWKYVVEYRAKRDDLTTEKETADEERTKVIDAELTKLKRDYANRAPEGVTQSNIDWVEEYTIKNQLLVKAKQFEVIDSSSYIKEGIDYDEEQIQNSIRALTDKEYRTPDGQLIQFVNEDGTLVDVQLAISRLQQGIAKWQSDTGDVGESSKIFTLIATYLNADVKAGGMGFSEWMMLILIAIVGIVQEFLIALFTPKSTIDRKLLYNYDAYFGEDFDIDRFLLKTFKDYKKKGVLTKKTYERLAQECVEEMENTVEDDILRFSKKKNKKPKEKEKIRLQETDRYNNIQTGYSSKVEDLVKEIDSIVSEDYVI